MSTQRARFLTRVGVLLLVLIPLSASPANAVPGYGKLDRQLANIAASVAANRADVLMSQALNNELFMRNSPLEARWNAAGQVQIYLRYDPNGGEPDLNAVQALGASELVINRQMGVIQAWVPAVNLVAATQIGGVLRVTIPRYARSKRVAPLGSRHFTGSVDTQGDSILGASQFRFITGLSGKGSVVGVMSDGDTNASKAAATGDLPGNIWNDPKNVTSFHSSGDEGTAMMEIIYDLAPGVNQLGFCGPATDVDFLTCLTDLQTGIKPTVIVDDLGFPGEAMFTDGNFAQGVQSFSNSNPSIRLVTAAGNDGNGFWSGQWNTPAPVATTFSKNGIAYTQRLNFGTAASPNPDINFTVQGTSSVPGTGDTDTYIMQWNDPWSDTATANINDDYDVFVFDSANNVLAYNQGTTICGTSTSHPQMGGVCVIQPTNGVTASNSSPGPQPVQGSSWTNGASAPTQVHMEVFLNPNSATQPGNNIKILVFSQNSFPVFLTPSTPGGLFGQAALSSPTEITVGAVPSSNGVCDFTTPTTQAESYSSRGPVVLGTTSGQTVETRLKPDFVAPDGVNTSGVGNFTEPFCGTSAAAPHIAGLLALLGSAYPNRVTYNLLSRYAAAPDGSAVPNGEFGNGLPNLTAMLNAGDFPPPTAVISTPAGNISVTTGAQTNFSGSCSANGASSAATLDWSFGNGSGIADSTSASTSATFSKTGFYVVTLTCTNSLGSGSSSVNVTAVAPSSGGGGMEWLELAGLLSALGARRRRKSTGMGAMTP